MTNTETNTLASIPILQAMIVREEARGCERCYDSWGDPAQAHAWLQANWEAIGARTDQESIVVLCLDTKHRLLGARVVTIGTLGMSLAHPREIFRPAVALNAHAIVMAHNHPSGTADPSEEDRRLTERTKAAGYLLGINMIDHIIVTDGPEWYSFAMPNHP